MSDTPRTDAYEEKMLFEGLADSFRTRNVFDTMRDLERELAAANKSFSDVTNRLRAEEECRATLEARCFEGFPSVSDGIFDALKEARKDAARYRAIRGLINYILDDEAGLAGVAFSYQVPLAAMGEGSKEELLDAVADAAVAMGDVEAPK